MNKYIKEPRKFEDDNIWYEACFPSLIALYNYLSSKPKVNTSVFSSRSSLSDDSSFGGEPLDAAINYLKGGYKNNYKEFLELKRMIDARIEFNAYTSEFEKTAVGSRVCIPNLLAGDPKFMLKPKEHREIKGLDVYVNLGYPHHTSEYEIRNRGLIVLNLIKILENNDYRVNLNTFEISYVDNEYVFLSLLLKQQNCQLNVSECYFPFMAKEFLRRDFFYLLETIPVSNQGWQYSYGKNIDNRRIRELLKLKESDILFGYPEQMGITDDLEESIKNCFEIVKLDKYVKVKKL